MVDYRKNIEFGIRFDHLFFTILLILISLTVLLLFQPTDGLISFNQA